MKQFKTFLIAIALIFGATAVTNAQSKIAHISSQELIKEMPAYKSAMTQLEALKSTYDADIKEMMTEVQTTVQRYEAEAPTRTDEENQKRGLEIQQTKRTIQQFQQNAMQKLQEKEVELITPVYEKAREVIHRVAREKGYDYVLNSTTGMGVILADGYNLMPDVKAALGI